MKTLGIVGFGSFGRFMVEHLRSRFEIRVHDLRDVEEDARRLGVEAATLAEVVDSETLVLAVPVQAMESVLQKLAAESRWPKLVVDVGSVKVKPLALMDRYVPRRVDVVGTHPMFGPQSGRHGIAGLKIVLCPLRCSGLDHLRELLARDLQLDVIEMTPEAHDRQIAYIQGLTHWIAKALREVTLPDLNLATPAYRHLLKIEEILREDSAALFRTIQSENPFSAEARAELLARLHEIERELLAGEGDLPSE